MGNRFHQAAFAVGCFALFTPMASAAQQSAPPGTVSGRGTAEIKKAPDVLRIQVDVLAKGKDLTEALARMKERREEARKKLETLGVTKGIVFGEPVLSSEKTDQQR